MVKKAKVDYDFENDVLYVYSGEKVQDSLEIEKFVLDFSFDNRIVGVEILNASKTLSNILNIKIGKRLLSSLKEAGISITHGKEMMFVLLILPVKMKGREDIRINVQAPLAVSA